MTKTKENYNSNWGFSLLKLFINLLNININMIQYNNIVYGVMVQYGGAWLGSLERERKKKKVGNHWPRSYSTNTNTLMILKIIIKNWRTQQDPQEPWSRISPIVGHIGHAALESNSLGNSKFSGIWWTSYLGMWYLESGWTPMSRRKYLMERCLLKFLPAFLREDMSIFSVSLNSKALSYF